MQRPQLSAEQRKYIDCLNWVRDFRKSNPQAAKAAHRELNYERMVEFRNQNRESVRAYNRAYMAKRRAKQRKP